MVTLTLDDLRGEVLNIASTKVVVVRPGFSTHGIVSLPVIWYS